MDKEGQNHPGENSYALGLYHYRDGLSMPKYDNNCQNRDKNCHGSGHIKGFSVTQIVNGERVCTFCRRCGFFAMRVFVLLYWVVAGVCVNIALGSVFLLRQLGGWAG